MRPLVFCDRMTNMTGFPIYANADAGTCTLFTVKIHIHNIRKQLSVRQANPENPVSAHRYHH